MHQRFSRYSVSLSRNPQCRRLWKLCTRDRARGLRRNLTGSGDRSEMGAGASSLFASFKALVWKPSVNQAQIGARSSRASAALSWWARLIVDRSSKGLGCFAEPKLPSVTRASLLLACPLNGVCSQGHECHPKLPCYQCEDRHRYHCEYTDQHALADGSMSAFGRLETTHHSQKGGARRKHVRTPLNQYIGSELYGR